MQAESRGEHNPTEPDPIFSEKPEPDQPETWETEPDFLSVKCRFGLGAHLSTRTDPTTWTLY